MKVIIKKPGCIGQAKDIPNTLEALQAEVGGYIETVTINSRLVAIVHEEGRLIGLDPNVLGLVGTIVFVGAPTDELPDELPDEFADIDDQSAQLLEAGYIPVDSKGNAWLQEGAFPC